MTKDDKVWAVTMVRDEEDIIGYTLRQLINEGVDGIIVADNNSTDNTHDILIDIARRFPQVPIIIENDHEVGYYQSDKMTKLAERAHMHGATWIVPADADECWYNSGDSLAEYLKSLPLEVLAVGATLYNHFCTALDAPGEPNPFKSMPYRQKAPGALQKVAVRYTRSMVIGMGNHDVSYYGNGYAPMSSTVELRHFPYRSPEQMVRKALNGAQAYKASTLPVSFGAHWRQYGTLIERYGEEAFIRDVWSKYYYFTSPTDAGLILDPAPYCRWVGR